MSKAPPAWLRDYCLDVSDMPKHPAELITAAALQYGDDPAFTVVLPNGAVKTLSFAELDALSDAFATFLSHSLGLSDGDVLAIKLPDGLAFPLAVFGAWKAGLIVTAINPLYTAAETIRQLTDSKARVLVGEAAVLDALTVAFDAGAPFLIAADAIDPAALLAELCSPPSQTGAAQAGRSSIRDALCIADLGQRISSKRHPVALYQYTGGTTGESKAAVITAANLLATTKLVTDFFAGFGEPIGRGNALTPLPLYHIFAFLFGVLVYVRAGTHNVLVPSPRPAAAMRPAFEAHAISWMIGVDTLYASLLAEDWFRATPPKLRFAIAGGAAVRPVVAAAWEDQVGMLLEGYGLTETTGIVSCNPPTGDRRHASVGFPVPGSQTRIVDAGGSDVPTGEPGELLVSGPQVAAGYRGAFAEEGAFLDGWLHTGDIATRDSAGVLTIVDRKKDMILVSGFNVYPNEIEAVLSQHPDVAEVAVIGILDEWSGEAVKAFVVARSTSPSADQLRGFCRERLAPYKIPREIVIADALPKSAVGKILRSKLR